MHIIHVNDLDIGEYRAKHTFNCSPGLSFGTRQDRVGAMYLC